jgi:ankyrin repeat protein
MNNSLNFCSETLEEAINNNNYKFLDLYLKTNDINSTDISFYQYEQDTLLTYALKSDCDLKMINYLIKKGADYEIMVQDAFDRYYSPIDYALLNKNTRELGKYWLKQIEEKEIVFKKLAEFCKNNLDIDDFIKFLDDAILLFNCSRKDYFLGKCFKIVCKLNKIQFAKYMCCFYNLTDEKRLITLELILNHKQKYLELFKTIAQASNEFLSLVIEDRIKNLENESLENIINDIDYIMFNTNNKDFVIRKVLRFCIENTRRSIITGFPQHGDKVFEIIKVLVEKNNAKLSFLILNPDLPEIPRNILKYILEKINEENLTYNRCVELSFNLASQVVKFDVQFYPVYHCLSKKVPPNIYEIKQLELDGKTIDKKGNTILFEITCRYVVDEGAGLIALKQLLCRGVDINHQNFKKETVLMETSNLSFTKLLLENNAKVDLVDNQNETALLKAVKRKNFEKANLLLEYKPDLQIKNKKGSTIFDYLHIYKYFYDESSNTIKPL